MTFARRDLKIRYAQTFLGVLWSIIRPLIGLIVYALFFGYLIGVDTGDLPYYLFAFSGLICWYFFSYIVSNSGTALLDSQYIIKKVHFPKLVLPLSKVFVGVVEFSISLIVLLFLAFFASYFPDLKILLLPLILAYIILAGLSIGIWLSALTVRFRDFHHIIPYLVNFGIFITPVFYPATLIPQEYAYLVYINPMAFAVDSMRWVLFDTAVPSIHYLASTIPVLILFVCGLFYFSRTESEMSDLI